MAIISLRAYNSEIEGMIDNGQLDEAVAHCRHILATFPKHIATYRLLGKAHLEQQRISDATDIFQRVLSSLPDDFIANVGMSIIREDENNLDSAIWHMELAYEAEPSNVAIQDELRRLYGRRDGMQPPKVRLTRGALARMYAKGELYDQAVTELRAAIAEDPNRPDLQLQLAEMFFQTGQRVEAVETCANILKKLPYCLEANRILAVCLPEAKGAEASRNYRQIVISMDPYYTFADPDAVSSDQVPDNAVNIERLDYKSGIQVPETPVQPNWAASLGILIEKPSQENIPDWLKSAEATAPVSDIEKLTPSVSPFIGDAQEVGKIVPDASHTEAEIPDWMKDAGWQPALADASQPPVDSKPPEPAAEAATSREELEKAEIPDWLRGIAPEGVLGEEKPAETTPESNLSTPWLEQHQPGPTDSIVHWLEDNKPETPKSRISKEEAVAPLSDEEVPEWLKDLEPAPPPPSGSTEPATVVPAFTIEPSLFEEETQTPQALQPVTNPLGAASEEGKHIMEEIQPPIVEPAEPEEEIPDWLKQLAGESIPAEQSLPATEPPSVGAFLTEEPQPLEQQPTPTEEAGSSEQIISEEPRVAEPAQAVEELVSDEVPALPEQPTTTEEMIIPAELQVEEAQPAAEIPTEQIPTMPEQILEPKAVSSEPVSAIEELPPAEVPAWAEGLGEESSPQVEEEIIPEQPIPAEQYPYPERALQAEAESALEQPLSAEVAPSATEIHQVEETLAPEQMPAPEELTQEQEMPSLEQPLPAEQAPVIAEESQVEEVPAPEQALVAEEIPPLEEITPGREQPPVEGTPEIAQEPALELPPVPEEMPQTEMPAQAEEEMKTFAWLEELAAEQVEAKETVPVSTEGGEIPPPEWVKLEAEPPLDDTIETQASPYKEKALPAEEIPDWIKGLGEEPETETPPEEPAEALTSELEIIPSEELPAWLRELEEPEPEKTEASTVPEGSEWKSDELPDWLKDITEVEPQAEKPSPVQAPISEEAAPAIDQPVIAETPAEVPAIEQLATVEEPIEEQPAPGIEQPAVLEAAASEAIPVASEAQPHITEPAMDWNTEVTPPAGIRKETLMKAPLEAETPAAPVEMAEQQVAAMAPEPASMELPPVPAEISQEQPDISLQTLQAVSLANQAALDEARKAFNMGEPGRAVELYNKLVSKNYHLDEIIKDLQDATYRFPIDPDLWVTLGDAFFHMEDLPEAMSAYIKAEELVR
jgi:tetratricopeptide (TPR) repeat protein